MSDAAQSIGQVYVKGLNRYLGLYLIDWTGQRHPRLQFPTITLWACPRCSFVPVHGGQAGLQSLKYPTFTHGVRSGRIFLSGCNHAPVIGPFDEAGAVAAGEKWNTWAERQAHARADRMHLDGETRTTWLSTLSDPAAAELRR